MELRLVPEYLSDEDLILQQRRDWRAHNYCSLPGSALSHYWIRIRAKKLKVPCPGGRLGGKGGVKGGKKKINKFHFIRREKMQE